MNRNINVRNFGLKNRDMSRALSNAYKELGNSEATNKAAETSFKNFSNFLKDDLNIKDLRNVERQHVIAYAEHLVERIENNEIKTGTAHDYLSHVNKAMSVARLDDKCRVEAVSDSKMPNRNGVAKIDNSATTQQHKDALNCVSERLGAQLEMQRELGLRFKESSLINASSAYQQALEQGKVTVDVGTKGGRTREVQITSQSQIDALKVATEIQSRDKADYSMIPNQLSWKEYQQAAYSEIAKTEITFHQERHHFANAMYERITGCKSPVQAEVSHREHISYIAKQLCVSREEARSIDKSARFKVAEALGHGRTSVTNAYLG